MGGLALIGTIASVAGTAISAASTIAGANAAAKQQKASGDAQLLASQQSAVNAEYQAKQYDIRAKEERAAAQQEAFAIQRTKRLALSRNQAVAAASGFNADDASVLNINSEIERYGYMQSAMANYGGESRAAGDEAQAAGLRAEGQAAVKAGTIAQTSAYASADATSSLSLLSAASTIIGGATTMFQKYGSSLYRAPSSSGSGYVYG